VGDTSAGDVAEHGARVHADRRAQESLDYAEEARARAARAGFQILEDQAHTLLAAARRALG
jgi:hypothetical protein